MSDNSWYTLFPLYFSWLVAGFAGVSFLYQAVRENARPAPRGWRKIIFILRYRLMFAAGIGLILWVLSGVFWKIAN